MPDLTLELATDHGNHYEVLDDARNVVGKPRFYGYHDPVIRVG